MAATKVKAQPLNSRLILPREGAVWPDGFKVEFFKKPHHHYRMGLLDEALTMKHKVPSVTQVLGTLDKSRPLVAWATRIDVAAALRMATEDWARCTHKGCNAWLTPIPAFELEPGALCDGCGYRLRHYRLPDEGWKLQRDIRLAGLDHDNVVGEAQLRGTTVHELHEEWVKERKLPNLGERLPDGSLRFRPEWHGYVRSYAKWLMANRDVDFESAEVLTGSRTHGFAGTCDTVAVTRGKDGLRTRFDFKTSKAIYPSTQFPQLAAYELGAVECGDDPTDKQAIVRLRADGEAPEVGYSDAKAEDFLVVLATWKSQKPWKDREQKAYRERRKKAAA